MAEHDEIRTYTSSDLCGLGLFYKKEDIDPLLNKMETRIKELEAENEQFKVQRGKLLGRIKELRSELDKAQRDSGEWYCNGNPAPDVGTWWI